MVKDFRQIVAQWIDLLYYVVCSAYLPLYAIRTTQYATIAKFAVLIFLFLPLTACSLIESPPTVQMPTPVATAVPWDANQIPSVDVVVDPASDIVPAIDPDIQSLIDSVSQQQLMGYVQTLEGFGTRSIFSETQNPDFGIGAARQWIFNEFTRVGNGRLRVEFQEFPLNYNGVLANPANVVATLPGSEESNQAIIIMAHYDNRSYEILDGESLAPGANDNASGVSLLLETARLLSSREWDNTIIFVALAAEEQGTYGASHFVQDAFLDGLDIVAAINYDGVGGREGIPQSVRLFAPNLLQSPSGELARYYEYIAGLYLPRFPVTVIDALDREGRYGDHREFINAGMPAIRVIESEEDPDLVNSKRDTWQLVDFNYLQQVVQLNVAVVANLAGAPLTTEPPLITARDIPGEYQIRWRVDDNAAGYGIVFRPLTETSYPTFRFVRARESGNVILTGLDPNMIYGVSMTALDEYGRLGDFTPEVIVEPIP